jgi:hypothetical protein
MLATVHEILGTPFVIEQAKDVFNVAILWPDTDDLNLASPEPSTSSTPFSWRQRNCLNRRTTLNCVNAKRRNSPSVTGSFVIMPYSGKTT